MIKIVYPNGHMEFQDVRRLKNHDLFLIFGDWATMRYLYTTKDRAGKPVDFYIVYQEPNPDWSELEKTRLLNSSVFVEYGIKIYGTAIICRSDVLDYDEE